MKLTGFSLFFLVFLANPQAVATEIYHWVDENGISNFSSIAPSGDVTGVGIMSLEDTTPPDYDPEEDLYGVQAQAERMASLRDEMEKKREAQRERDRNSSQQPVVQYRDRYQYGLPYYGRPYPRPPLRPEPPIEVPYETATLRPPGRSSN